MTLQWGTIESTSAYEAVQTPAVSCEAVVTVGGRMTLAPAARMEHIVAVAADCRVAVVLAAVDQAAVDRFAAAAVACQDVLDQPLQVEGVAEGP